MKDFSRRGYQIGQATAEVKIVYTGFLLFAAIGYLTLVMIALTRIGPGYQQVVEHYRGSDDGELLPRSVGQMIEETHVHAFIQGLTLLVLAHLFVATSMDRRVHRGVVVVAFGATFADLAAPWLVRFVSSGFAAMQMGSWVVMTGSAVVLIGAPLYDMWWKGTK